ncbi:MAG: hypothetical protein PHN88_16230 [Ignavibacteria bacterium]|nr:hypothetical protein [Ignavibacteria bacterium]
MARETSESKPADKEVKKLREDLDKALTLLDALLKRLAKTEPILKAALKESDTDDEIYLVPGGTWFGVKY